MRKAKPKKRKVGMFSRLFAAAALGISSIIPSHAGSGRDSIPINGDLYSVSGDSIVQLTDTHSNEGCIRLAVVSGIQGIVDCAERSAAGLKEERNIRAIIITGNSYLNGKLFGYQTHATPEDDIKRMVAALTPYARLGLPIFIVPGNHEEKAVYDGAIAELRKSFPNVFDINGITVDGKGFNLVGLGGYYDPMFTAKGGFLLHGSDYKKALKQLLAFKKQGEPTVFVTYCPPKAEGPLDALKGMGHVGDEGNREIMNDRSLENIIIVSSSVNGGDTKSSNEFWAGTAITAGPVSNDKTYDLTIDKEGSTFDSLKW